MTLWSRIKSLALVGLVAGAVMVPLYGDPHSTQVTHAEWARMLLRGLGMEAAVPLNGQASQAFATLTWRNTLDYAADRYVRGDGVSVQSNGGTPEVVASSAAPGEVAYPLAIVKGGTYRLRLRLRGNPGTPAAAEITRVGATTPVGNFTVTPVSGVDWVDAGRSHLDPGAYTASVLLPVGLALQKIEVQPPCLNPIEPLGGWRATSLATTGDVAVTVLKALDKESELAPAASPIEISGADFQILGAGVSFASAQAGAGLDGLWLKSGPSGRQAIVSVDVPEPGLYTVSVFGIEGRGQSWLGDSCQKSILCPAAEAAGPRWRVLTTTAFASGRHTFTVTLGDGAAVGRLRLERRKDSTEDYEAALRRVGFDPGPSGVITRAKAADAVKFIGSARKDVLGSSCGDVTAPSDTILQAQGGLAQPAGPVAGPAVPPLHSGAGQPPLAPPVIPPQQPASPVTP